jgi:hypothetical protein
MIVNAAVFTCSICGESSVNICSYCTKDACSNHRCERCKRCSDCCECEFPLSAEEPVAIGVVTELSLDPGSESLQSTEAEAAVAEGFSTEGSEAEGSVLEDSEIEAPEVAESLPPSFLTLEESSVFAPESESREPRVFDESSVFAEEDDDPPKHGA